MTGSSAWLPPLVEFDGDWFKYVEVIYAHFCNDFVASTPAWNGRRVSCNRYPEVSGKWWAFWHVTSGIDKKTHEINEPDLERCARVRWVRAVIEGRPGDVVAWEQVRLDQTSLAIALPDFSYVVFLKEFPDRVHLRTAYYVKPGFKRDYYRNQYESSGKR